VEGFYRHLEQAMAESGFFDPEHPKKLMPRLRRLFARAGLEPEEVNILRGIVKTLARSGEKCIAAVTCGGPAAFGARHS
ncbi:MAG: hypothetical protein ACXWUK_16170, partial [Burkholderiales bacterium]